MKKFFGEEGTQVHDYCDLFLAYDALVEFLWRNKTLKLRWWERKKSWKDVSKAKTLDETTGYARPTAEVISQTLQQYFI